MYTIITCNVNAHILRDIVGELQPCSPTGDLPETHFIFHGEVNPELLGLISGCDVRDGDLIHAIQAVGLQLIS